MEESYKLDKAIDLLISEVKIYDQYYCLATSQALKTVLNELERLQKENELAKETIKNHCSDMDKVNNILAKLQSENEELKTLANKTQWISPCYVSENYIPKQAIRDTIEELESYKRKEWDTYNAHLSGKIAILKELLGE